MSITDDLRMVTLFEKLTDSDLAQLADGAIPTSLEPGEVLFREGEVGDSAYVICEGELEILLAAGERDVLLARRGVGDIIGEFFLFSEAPRSATVRAATDTGTARLIGIPKPEMDQLIERSPTASRALFASVFSRLRQTENALVQSQRMVQLGTLTAGLAHELNNPAAAVKRGADQLGTAIETYGATSAAVARTDLDAGQQVAFAGLEETATGPDPILNALERSDLEADMESALDAAGVAEPWIKAGPLVAAGFSSADVRIATAAFGDQTGVVFDHLAAAHDVSALVNVVNEGATRLSTIVGALKSYSHLDQAPLQDVDVRKGIEDTLLILKAKLADITVEREYQDIPDIHAFGGELNQVWTNLIDNAADAVTATGRDDGLIVIRTRPLEDRIEVEIEDNGGGIPDDIADRIYDPFFTTKPPGQGTGLGLDISFSIIAHKHRGDITAENIGGGTRFTVRLPHVAPNPGSA